MKKIIALMLVLCMVLAAVPVFAESAGGSGLGDLLSGLMGGSESGEGKESGLGGLLSGLLGGEGKEGGLGSQLSGLVEELKKEGKEKISQLTSKLKGKVMEVLLKELANPDSKLSALLGKLAAGKNKGSDDSAGIGALLGTLACVVTTALLSRLERKSKMSSHNIYTEVSDIGKLGDIADRIRAEIDGDVLLETLPAKSGMAGHIGLNIIVSI